MGIRLPLEIVGCRWKLRRVRNVVLLLVGKVIRLLKVLLVQLIWMNSLVG
jgi:hypothetical protein